MDHAQLDTLGARFRARRDKNRTQREKTARSQGLLTLAIGLLGGLIVVAVLAFAMR